MLSNFYKKYSVHLLCALAISFPFLTIAANSIPSNNDIETWLPKDSPVRATYEQFKRDFGVEEVIVLGIDRQAADDQLIESLATRLDQLPGIRQCWTPARMQQVMTDLGVSPEEAARRLEGLVMSESGQLVGMVALLSDAGLKDRPGTVADVRAEIDYCQLRGEDVCLTGAPVIVTELDHLGSQNSNRKFFLVTLALSLGLLYFSIGHWGMSFGILGLTIWGINLTQAVICWCGGEMNFILGALSVMVMIFTLSVAVHFLSYYSSARDAGAADPLGNALRHALKPCFLATLTTLIGLVSLTMSNILPVTQFGFAAAVGALVAFLTGLGLTPALLVIWPQCGLRTSQHQHAYERLGSWVARRNRLVIAVTAATCFFTYFGLRDLQTDINPVDFLPANSKVLTDLRRVEADLTNIDSIEAVVDFRGQDLPFLDRLQVVRELEQKIGEHAAVRHTTSLATFFPTELPDTPIALMRLLKQARSQEGQSDFLAEGDRLWRISARISSGDSSSKRQILDDLTALTAGAPIHFTGITPLLESAQLQIFTGFWESFTTAFLIISGVMVVSLWSLKAGAVAMIPNLAPIWFVFGILGLLGQPVDIGMMMSGSIALGIAVDGTFHFLVRYQEFNRYGKNSSESARLALSHCGEPILNSAIVASVGMLALGMSNFAPTARFGFLMTGLLLTNLLGDFVILPALLSWRSGKASTDPVSTSRPTRREQRAKAKAVERVA